MGNLRFVHRTTSDGEIYWINNRTGQSRVIDANFRVSGLKPILWHAETGKTEDVSYAIKDSTTSVHFNMVANDAVFIVFRGKADKQSVTLPEKKDILFRHIDMPWTVNSREFGRATGGDIRQTDFFHRIERRGHQIFLGTATYKNTMLVAAPELKQGRFVIDLGKVGCLAQVFVNGKDMGTLWKSPYRADITEVLKAGTNDIEIRVTNLWVNRIIGDLQPDCKTKYTYPAFPFYKADSPLLPSGLMGPVDIFVEQDNPLPYHSIKPGQIILDTNGKPIQAHGFQIFQKDGTYYWYGENKEFTTRGSHVWTYGIRCYKSKDFYNWEDCGLIIKPDTVNPLSPLHYTQTLDRPHIIFCKRTGKYVCWIKSMDEDGYFVILQADDFLGPIQTRALIETRRLWRGRFRPLCRRCHGQRLRGLSVLTGNWFVPTSPMITPPWPANFIPFRGQTTAIHAWGTHIFRVSGQALSVLIGHHRLLSQCLDDRIVHRLSRHIQRPRQSAPTDKFDHSFCSQITDVVKIPGKTCLSPSPTVGCRRWQTVRSQPQRQSAWLRNTRTTNHSCRISVNQNERQAKRCTHQWDVTYNATYVFLPITFKNGVPQIEWKEEGK